MRLPHRRGLVVLACLPILALVTAACGEATKPPTPTPADFPGITRVLGPLGISVTQIVSGEPGCDDAHLNPTAIAFTARGLDQATPVRVHAYLFADDDAFQRNLDAIDSCARSYVTDPAGYEKIAVSPYVLAAQGPFAPAFKATLTSGLTTAASAGG